MLENGERILSTRGVMKSLNRGFRGPRAGAEIKLPVFLEAANLKPFISEDLAPILKSRIFRIDKGSRGATPTDTMALSVYMSTWVRLKDRVRHCQRGVTFWESLFWTSLGIVVTSGVPAYLDFVSQTKFTITPWMFVTAIFFVSAVLGAIASRQARKHEADSVEAILAEMEEIQARFSTPPR